MSDFITLKCPSCGGKLELAKDIDQFYCAHCGTEHMVKRGGGTIVLSPVVEGLKHVQTGVDKTASELAIKRLQDEINKLKSERQVVVYSSNTNYENIGAIKGFFIGFGLGLILLLFVPDSFFLAMFVAGLGAFIGYSNGKTKKEEANRPELERIDRIIQSKEQELAKHKELVGI